MSLPFHKVLVANRGEIACRVLATCERLGLATVAVFSDADVTLPHVAAADEAVRLGPAPAKDSYLSIPALIAAVRETGADAVHPGYGLLSENADFAQAVNEAGAVFIGPSPAALRALGDKIEARRVARAAGAEPPPGSDGPVDPAQVSALREAAERIGFPLLVKAAGGGGGIGMQIVKQPSELEAAAKTCSDRSRAAFSDARIYLERYLERPHHIEVQVLRDRQGGAVALGERECSAQRRHQKVVEETPSPAAFFAGEAGQARRTSLFERALAIMAAVDYVGAGTVEFVADGDGNLFFLEVNARLQVEHPVTECVTGLDLVEQQLRVAAGEALGASVLNAPRRGHAIEVRLYAEDPQKNFMPQPGRLERFSLPTSEGVRVDSGYAAGNEVTPYYDPLLAKIIAHAETREQAIERLLSALSAADVRLVAAKGTRTSNLEFLKHILASEEFRAGDYDTGILERLRPSGR